MTRGALPVGPGGELLESLDRGRRRRDEPRDLLGRQQGTQRRRVFRLQLTQRHAASGQDRKLLAPVRRDDRGTILHQRKPARLVHIAHAFGIRHDFHDYLPPRMLSVVTLSLILSSSAFSPQTMLSPQSTLSPQMMLSPQRTFSPQTML